jgi:ATP-dependent RNA helicase RhlB
MNLPEFIAVTPETVTVEGIEQSLYHVGSDKKVSLLLGLLTREEWSRMLIFVNTKAGVEMLTHKLKGNGWPAEGITGDLPQPKRFRLMEQFKKGQIKILLATDVASRGIHVEDISHVINYDLPQEAENYIHRIGRTARAGKTGRALSLACEHYVFHLESVEDMLGYKIPVIWPGDDWFVADRSKPLGPRRRPQPKRSPQPTRSPQSKRSSQPRTRGAENKRQENRNPREKSKSSHFPGAFFGFGPEPILEPKPEPKPAPKPEAKPEPKPEAKPAPKPEAKPEPKSAPKSELKPEPQIDPPKRKRKPSRRRKRSSPKSSPVESKDE